MTRAGDVFDAVRLGAFLDGELPLDEQLAVEGRLRADPELRARVDGLEALRETLQAAANYHAAPAGLTSRLGLAAPGHEVARPDRDDALAAPADPPPTRAAGGASAQPATPVGVRPAAETASPQRPGAAPKRVAPPWRRLLAWRLPVPALPALVAAGLAVTWLVPDWRGAAQDDARLAQEAIAAHVRSTVGQRVVDVASSDRHTVKPWLSARLDYSPPVPEPPVAGAVFLGARLDYLDGRPVAVLVYRQRLHLIDAYVWPASGRDAGLAARSQRGFNSVAWVHAGMRFWLVSDLNGDELGAFARAVAEADAAR